MNASPITKITSWLKFLGKNLHLVGCATLCAKSEVMLTHFHHIAVSTSLLLLAVYLCLYLSFFCLFDHARPGRLSNKLDLAMVFVFEKKGPYYFSVCFVLYLTDRPQCSPGSKRASEPKCAPDIPSQYGARRSRLTEKSFFL